MGIQKTTEQQLMDANVMIVEQAQELAFYKTNKEKFQIEFNRYKQDCRKRALDLAAGEYAEFHRTQSRTGTSLPEGNGHNEPNILKLADKYYNWLISIPT